MKYRKCFALVFVALVLAGLTYTYYNHVPTQKESGPEQEHREVSQSKNNEVVIGDADIDSVFVILRTDPLRVVLPVQLGTGYSWVAKTPDCLVLDNQKIIPGDGTPGGFERQSFLFRPDGVGEGTLVFNLCRPWQKNQSIKTRTVKVQVVK